MFSSFLFSRGTAVPLTKAKLCLSYKQNCVSRGKNVVSLSKRHGRASHKGKTVLPAEAKPSLLRKKHVFPFRGARSLRQNRASRGSKTMPLAKKNQKIIFFISESLTKAKSCSHRKNKKHDFCDFLNYFFIKKTKKDR